MFKKIILFISIGMILFLGIKKVYIYDIVCTKYINKAVINTEKQKKDRNKLIEEAKKESKNQDTIIKKLDEKHKIHSQDFKREENTKKTNLSKKDAIKLVKDKFYPNENSKIKYKYYGYILHNDKELYVIRVYKENESGNSRTIWWFDVDKNTGKIYTEDKNI